MEPTQQQPVPPNALNDGTVGVVTMGPDMWAHLALDSDTVWRLDLALAELGYGISCEQVDGDTWRLTFRPSVPDDVLMKAAQLAGADGLLTLLWVALSLGDGS